MTFDQWWEVHGVEYSSHEDFARKVWIAAQQNSDSPSISIGHGASVSGLIVVQPQEKEAV